METAESRVETFLVNEFGDRYLYSVNRNTFNMHGSDSLYRSLIGDKLFQEYQLNIIIGTDSGVFPRYVAKNEIPAGARYIFVELPTVLEALRQESVLDELPPEISVVTLDQLMEQAEKYQLTEYVFLDAVRVQESAASGDANLPEYRELSWCVNREVTDAKQQTWSTTYSAQFTHRQLENLTENRVAFCETLMGAFAGRTAVILAGGPSLRGALPWVRENRERVLVIAVSRISRILQEEGIVPHMIVSVDPQKISFEVSREMLLYGDAPEAPLFAYSHHASPQLVGQWAGKSVYYGQLLPWQSPLNVDNLSYNGPTVSNSALSLALHMGCSSVVLAGVDLCFSAEGNTHAAGSNESKIGPDLSQLTPQLQTYGGRNADTNQGYADSLHVLGLQAKMAAEKGCKLYNCSLDAAQVPLIEYMLLEELELAECDESPSGIINRLVPSPTQAMRRTHYRRIKKEVERARSKFQEILNLSNEALECTDGLFGRNGMQRDFRHKIRMDKIERRLDGSLKYHTALVKRFGLKKFLTILRTPKKAEEWSDEQIETATREYYEAYREGTQTLIGHAESVLARIESRMQEEQPDPDLPRLFNQWEKDGQCGRLAIWRRRSPELAGRMTPAQQSAAERVEREFSRVMAEEATTQMTLLEKLHDLKLTRGKALILFKRQAIPELEDMSKGLANHPDQEKALPYLNFVEGLLAELSNEPEQACARYQQLLTNPPHLLTEDALLQIANLSIAVNDADNALLAIECLTGISPTYLPPYGEILKVVGRFEDAFNAYNRYLGMVPDDVGALVRLGIFCREASMDEAARELFNRALAKDPVNGAAQRMLAELDPATAQLSA